MVDQGEQARRRHRRPPVHVRLVAPASTRSASTTSSGARTTASPATTSTSRATPRRASTPARSSRAGSTEDDLDHFRREIGRQRAVVVPAPAAHARLLGVPDGVDGPRPDQLDLPRPLQPVPAEPPARRHEQHAGVVLRRRRRVRRARDARLDLARRRASGSTTSSSSSTATCSASTARCAATARSSRSSRPSFRGAGWNVIKVIWGSKWDELLARDVDGVLLNKMNTTVDGEFQRYTVESGAYIREHFFGPDPRLRKLVEHLSDDELRLPAPRRARLPQALRRLQGRRRERGSARRRSSSPRRSRAGRSAPTSRAATRRTRSRR